jgi:hypothetical protein
MTVEGKMIPISNQDQAFIHYLIQHDFNRNFDQILALAEDKFASKILASVLVVLDYTVVPRKLDILLQEDSEVYDSADFARAAAGGYLAVVEARVRKGKEIKIIVHLMGQKPGRGWESRLT